MPRNKPYRKRVLLLDIFLTWLTQGAWLVYVVIREIFAFKSKK